MTANAYDVIGLGGLGSATLYQLARRGLKVLGLDRFEVGHHYGSSHGLTRIIRLAYYEHPSYVPLLRRAYELWRQIEDEAHEKLFYQTGSIDAGPEDSLIFAGSLQSCLEHNLEHEVLTSAELSARFPGYQFPPETMAVLQPQGGLLIPELCISAHLQAARTYGAAMHTQERVLDWDVHASGVRVMTEAGEYTAQKLVITAGSWTGKLIPLLRTAAVPERQVLIWMEVLKPEWFRPERFPVFNCSVPDGNYYGFPEFNPDGTTPGFKYGRCITSTKLLTPMICHGWKSPGKMKPCCGSSQSAIFQKQRDAHWR
jgi:sarcosine oxidase